jgi:hypothetical protein
MWHGRWHRQPPGSRTGVHSVVCESPNERAVRTAFEAKATTAPKKVMVPTMRYHLPSDVSAEPTPMREKTTAPTTK